jgi:hypothetical protein
VTQRRHRSRAPFTRFLGDVLDSASDSGDDVLDSVSDTAPICGVSKSAAGHAIEHLAH